MEDLKTALEKAFGGEAKASVRLKVYADKAKEENLPQIAKLFRAVALSEEVHGKRALRLLKEIRSTEENLEASFQSESGVARISYIDFVRQAEAAGDQAAVLFFSQSRDVEERHATLYKYAMNHLLEERETNYYLCLVCGYISDGAIPDTCPICGAGSDNFNSVE